jgi:hypothetical protein
MFETTNQVYIIYMYIYVHIYIICMYLYVYIYVYTHTFHGYGEIPPAPAGLAFAPWDVGTFSGGQFHQHLDDGVRHVSHWSPWDLHVMEK